MSQALTIAPSHSIAPIHPRDDMRPSFERGVREFQTEAEMKAASLEVRRRLFSARPIAHVRGGGRQWSYSPAPFPVLPEPDAVIMNGEEFFGPFVPSTKFLIQSFVTNCGISLREMQSGSRLKEHVAARHSLIRLLHSIGGMSAASIGRLLDKDHTSILYVINGNHRRKKLVK